MAQGLATQGDDMNRLALLLSVFGLTLIVARAEPGYNRPLFSRENCQLALEDIEVGVLSQFQQFDESKNISGADWTRETITITPYVRYGLYENLTAFAKLPFVSSDSDRLNKTYAGLGDVSFGLELLAYEDVFGFPSGYPYIIPYVEFILPTGDDDKYLGHGRADAVIGASVGTTVAKDYHYVLDARYNVNYSEDDNGVFSLSIGFIWDISRRFSIMLETKGTSEETEGENRIPIYFSGGMFYRVTDNLMLSWYGGGALNAEEEGMGALKIGYRF